MPRYKEGAISFRVLSSSLLSSRTFWTLLDRLVTPTITY